MKPISAIGYMLVAGLVATLAQHGQSNSASMTLTSPDFPAGAEIPQQYTCKGADMSPAVSWNGAPANSASFALIMDDPDAPAGTWVHWVIWNVPANAHSLGEAVPRQGQLEDGAVQGRNSFHKTGYNGPCPPGGAPHHYFFRLYALDAKLDLTANANRASLDVAMKGHILAETEYIGTFHR